MAADECAVGVVCNDGKSTRVLENLTEIQSGVLRQWYTANWSHNG